MGTLRKSFALFCFLNEEQPSEYINSVMRKKDKILSGQLNWPSQSWQSMETHIPVFELTLVQTYLLGDGFLSIFFLFVFLGPYMQHMEAPRLGVESKLQLLAYATATAVPDPSSICDLYHSSRQCWVLNPLSETRDRTCVLMDTRCIHYH